VPEGLYTVWVVNNKNRAGGAFRIEVEDEGAIRHVAGTLPATAIATSERFEVIVD
jgi:hypothetical protein